MTNTRFLLALSMLALPCAWAQSDLVAVVSKPVSRTVELPAEVQPFLQVALHAKVPSYVDRILVDRGSVVKQGQALAELSAPELSAQLAEAASKAQAAQAERAQAEAQLAAEQATLDRLKKAAETPGAIAGNELVVAEKRRDAAQALVNARQQAAQAADGAVRALKEVSAYLKIAAPFDGVITERLVHPGALVGPGNDSVLLVLQQIARLRVVVAVPEHKVSGIVRSANVAFRVPAWPDRNYAGVVTRISRALDAKTRTMAVELDAANHDGSLAPGMYATVKWPVRRGTPALYVPKTSVVTTTERTFVVRLTNGRAEWVSVTKGAADGDLIEVLGNLKSGDLVVRRATDEIREGVSLTSTTRSR